jgi:hypothetical protein
MHGTVVFPTNPTESDKKKGPYACNEQYVHDAVQLVIWPYPCLHYAYYYSHLFDPIKSARLSTVTDRKGNLCYRCMDSATTTTTGTRPSRHYVHYHPSSSVLAHTHPSGRAVIHAARWTRACTPGRRRRRTWIGGLLRG